MRCHECKQPLESVRAQSNPAADELYCAGCHLSYNPDGTRYRHEPTPVMRAVAEHAPEAA